MAEPAKAPATYQDVLDAPPHRVAEVIGGVLYTSPRPAARHARASSRLGGRLSGPFDEGTDGPGGWVILFEPELHLGSVPDIVVPDLAGWRRTRMPEVPLEAAFFTLAPDWICEVLSPSTAQLDRAEKMDVYAREAVEYAWLIDAQAKTLEVYRNHDHAWLRLGVWHDEATVSAEPFAEVPLPLAVLWAS